MLFRYLMPALLLLVCQQATAMFPDDPWLTKTKFEIEYFNTDGQGVIEWDIDLWSGRDLRKYWFKSSGERAGSELKSANLELVYSRAINAFWDQQFGLRHDPSIESVAGSRNWLSYGFIGTAAYFIDLDARLFIGEESSSQLVIESEREYMLSQQWILTPELDIFINGRSNPDFREGSGLSKIELSLRLGYEHKGNRKFQPFVGLFIEQTFGTTRNLLEANGDDDGHISAMFGIHGWF